MIAIRVHSDTATLNRMRYHIERLSAGSHVRVSLDDGQAFSGTVRTQPALTEGEDGDGNRGQAATLTLWDEQPLVVIYVDRIVGVEPIE